MFHLNPETSLTNFFDLSNIPVESWGAVEMFGASRCTRTVQFQFDGRTALAADSPLRCNFSIQSRSFRGLKKCVTSLRAAARCSAIAVSTGERKRSGL